MPEINPYESPQSDLQPAKKSASNARGVIRPYVFTGLQLMFIAQLVALSVTMFAWLLSELSVWGNDIQHSAKIAIVSGSIAAFFGIVIIVAAKKQNKPRWVFFEILLISILIVCALVRLS